MTLYPRPDVQLRPRAFLGAGGQKRRPGPRTGVQVGMRHHTSLQAALPFGGVRGWPIRDNPRAARPQRRWPWERTATWGRAKSGTDFLAAAAGEHPGSSQAPDLVKGHITLDTPS